jgi:hypothetical protein
MKSSAFPPVIAHPIANLSLIGRGWRQEEAVPRPVRQGMGVSGEACLVDRGGSVPSRGKPPGDAMRGREDPWCQAEHRGAGPAMARAVESMPC